MTTIPSRTAPPVEAGRKAAPPRWSYRPELDGMRGLGAVVIIFFHAQVAGFSASFIVLDMFFVLSGFVVTNVLLGEIDVTGRLDVGAYYARRVRRLLPAAVVTIVVTCGLFVLVASQPERLPLVRHAQAALLYLANWQFIGEDADYFAGDIRDSPFMHFWSLSVEEQYYIFFPLLVIAWLRWGRARPRVLLAVVGLLFSASVTAQVVLAQVDPMRAYFGTDTRLFQLLAGVGLAVALRELGLARDPDGAVSWPRAGRALAAVGALGFLVFGSEAVSMTVSNRNLVATAVSAALIVGAYTAPTGWVATFLALPWPVYLGKISYGIYLWHWPTIVALDRIFTVRPVLLALMTLPLACGLAAISYQLLETPIRRGRRLDRFDWQCVGAGVTVSVLAATVVVGPVLRSDRMPVVASGNAQPPAATAVSDRASDGDRLGRQLQKPVPQGLDFDALVKDRGPEVPPCTPTDLDACRVAEGGGLHVVLVGDSHARMLTPAFTALAEDQGLTLSAQVVPACPWPHGLLSTKARASTQEECVAARRGFYTRTLPRLEPDVVVLANAPRAQLSWADTLVDYDGADVAMPGGFDDAVRQTLQLIERAGARTIIVGSVMGTQGWGADGPDPLDCLARARTRGECVVVPPMERPRADSYYEVATGDSRTAATIDLNPMVCPDHPVCLPVVDGQVVWRNADHVTADYLTQQREEIWDAMAETGLLAD